MHVWLKELFDRQSVSPGSQWTKPAQQGDHGGSSDRSSACTPCVSISRGSVQHRQISGEPLTALARVSPCLQPRLNSQLAMARATSPATVYFSMGCECEDHTCDSVVSTHPAPLRFWCYEKFETLSALFPERNQITMKLHVEICHVSPTLPRSNSPDASLRNRSIVSVLSPIQDRRCLTETPRSLHTTLVPRIQPSFLTTLETLNFGKSFLSESHGHRTSSWPLAQRQDW